jgi:2',3'-cyclic-nucleotide 2'-phosphodiesterase (5'-nucleotidase family)
VLDTGDLYHRLNTISEGEREAADVKADLYMKAYSKAGCKGLGIGDRDVGGFGVAGLKKLEAKGKFPFLCSNLTDVDGKPVFTPYTVVEAAGYKVGIFALLTPGANLMEKEKYRFVPPVESAKAMVEKLKNEKVDAIILLAHLDKRDVEKVIAEVADISVVLGGQSMSHSRSLERLGNTWWAEAGQKSKHVNVITLNVVEPGLKPFVVREESDKLKTELAGLDNRIKRYVKLAQGPATPGTRSASKGRFQGVISSLVKQREGLAARTGELKQEDPNAPFLAFEAVPLNKKQREDEEVAGWVTTYNAKYDTKAKRPGLGHGGSRKGVSRTPTSRKIPHEAIRAVGGLKGTKGGAMKSGMDKATTPAKKDK